jgi:HSP20 family molecular chaperone IbpA
MARDDIESWMWAGACESLALAERMHREFFVPTRSAASRQPVWRPPADVIETEREVLITVALPGVDPAAVEAVIEGGALRVAGRRILPSELHAAAIHRLELPQGHFERSIPLPPGRYKAEIQHSLVNGCLLVRLDKLT